MNGILILVCIIMGQKNNKIVFTENKEQISHLLKNQELLSIISKKEWNLNNSKYRKLECKKLFSHIRRITEVEALDFGANNEPAIPEHISHLSLTCLITLNLSGNYICSLQKLSFLDMKNLEVLNLEWNFITSLDSFHKNNLNNLQKLSLCNNPLLTMRKFERSNTFRLKQLWLEDENEKKQSVPDAVWKLAKMQIDSLYSVKILAKNRIKIKNITLIKKLKRKSTIIAFQRLC